MALAPSKIHREFIGLCFSEGARAHQQCAARRATPSCGGGAKPRGLLLSVREVAELPNSGWATKISAFREERARMQPRTTITPETHWGRRSADCSKLVNLGPLMERTSGATQIVIGLMDGPVAMNHPDLAAESIREIAGEPSAGCAHSGS